MSKLELFITKGCLSFEPAMALFNAVQAAFPALDAEVIDCRENRDRALAAGVIIDPSFVLDGKVVSSGLPGKNELVQKIRICLKK